MEYYNNEKKKEYQYKKMFDTILMELWGRVDSKDPLSSIGEVFYDVLRYYLVDLFELKFIKHINIFNNTKGDPWGDVEFYADLIHSAGGTNRVKRGKELVTRDRSKVDIGGGYAFFERASAAIESLFYDSDANPDTINNYNIFEHCHNGNEPIEIGQYYSQLAYNYSVKDYGFYYEHHLFEKIARWENDQKVKWLVVGGLIYDLQISDEITNSFVLCGNKMTKGPDDITKKYAVNAIIGIDNRKEDEQVIRSFVRRFQDFIEQLSKDIIDEVKKHQLRQTAVVASIAQVMARNMSHNIGSHVFSNLIGSDVYCKLTDRNILKYKSYVSIYDTEIEYPKEQDQDVESHANNMQLSYFNQYLKNRMDYLSEVTFGVPNMLTNRYVYADVFKELDCVRILLNYISGISGFKYTFCLKHNGVVLTSENDIAVAFPSDVLGNQAFYNIIENIIRNTAKHAFNNNQEVVTFTIEFTDIEDFPDYYCVEIDNGIEELDIVELVKKQNKRINDSVLDQDNNLRSHSLGLLEMEASAAFLRQVDIAKVDSYEYHFEDTDGNKNKYENLILLKAINKNGALGYRFFMQKPKEFLLVGNFDVAYSKKNAVDKEGVQFISEEDFAKAISDGKSFAHPFLFYPNNVSDKTKALLSNDNDSKTLLPIRIVKLNQDETNELLTIIKESENILFQLKDYAWKKYMRCLGFEDGDIHIGEVISRRFNNCHQIVFENHGKRQDHENNWSKRTVLPELWIDNLSSYTQSKLPSFAQFSKADDCIAKKPLTSYIESIPLQIKLEIFEAYHNKVVVLDERIQRFALESYEGSSENGSQIPSFELFESTNVVIPNIKLDPERFDDTMIHELESFINNEIGGAFLLIHYGILERMYKTEHTITERLEEWAKKSKRVVVTSGRGSHSLQLPDSVCFANLSSVLNAFTENRCKYVINCVINQSRRKK